MSSLSALVACAPESVTTSPTPSSPSPEPASLSLALRADQSAYVAFEAAADRFPLATGGASAPLYVSSEDFPGVVRVAGHLRTDIGRVTGTEPTLTTDQAPASGEVVLIGTLGKSPLITQLVDSGKLDVAELEGRWDTFVTQVVDAPMTGVTRALVIAGSNKRGTIYGMYELAAQIGVSPWHFWADVPPKQRAELHVLPGRHTLGEPKVKYRGFFINDENPALLGWFNATWNTGSGRFNSEFYERVFELLLRLRANYLWPAMWGKAFYDDDAKNGPLADEYGIVMGTSHHEPLTRAQEEWARYGTGDWNYETNANTLKQFWTEGIERMGDWETLVTVGMRGDGDVPLTEEANIALLEQIVADQRQIIQTATGRDPATVPQVWTLYKEVQDYHDKGMEVPDDITLMFADDNWGNIRKLPQADAAPRAGGYGIYYHYDYVGDPRNYKWINTNPLPRIWEQMHLAYRHGATQVWIVNVGDIKPMEFPIQFFMDLAWNPEEWAPDALDDYARIWAEQQFGPDHAAEIGDILAKYAKYNGRRKPELLEPGTYSVVNYLEAERIAAEYNALAEKAEEIDAALPSEARDAYYQLVLYPVAASANLNDLYVTVAKNRLYAAQGRAATNALAERARDLFARDAELTDHYHTGISGGKWNHMMSQTHIGYVDWQEPAMNTMPAVEEITVPMPAELAVAVEGSESFYRAGDAMMARLPEITPYNDLPRYIEVFNRGETDFEFTATAGEAWLTVEPAQGMVDTEQRLTVNVDFATAPKGEHEVPVTITGPNGSSVVVQVPVRNPEAPSPDDVVGYVETDGYVSIDAEQFTTAVNNAAITWQVLPDLGRTSSAVTPFPVTAPPQTPGGDSARLEYQMHLFHSGDVTVHAYFSPSLDYKGTGLRYGVSFDDAEPQVFDITADDSIDTWRRNVSDNIIVSTSTHAVTPGDHVLKIWAVDTGVVLQKLVVATGALRPSYLGPPAFAPKNHTPPPSEGGAGGTSGEGGAGAAAPVAGSSGGEAPSAGTAGTPPTAGSPGQGGSTAGSPNEGEGAGGPGSGSAGNAPSGAGGSDTGAPAPSAEAPPSTSEGCGCRVPAAPANDGRGTLAALALGALAVLRRRRGVR
ncbi:MAG TPA: glycosyl hydrolase 115 family protein [Polyangiaceae bacterium]|nr:glycosyl hydrolase 115 family protein [Polyangiaceae bacterium]